MTTEEAQAELELRQRQLAARDGKPGLKRNCEALRARIAELEAIINGG